MKPLNPIEHAVIIVKENHSFDNYFGLFPGVNGTILPAAQDPGTLPNVSWVYAPTSRQNLSEHPPYGANAGQPTVKLGTQWTAARIAELGKSSLWPKMVIFITWDDWGGWYDHVEPPLKDKWTGGSPTAGPSYSGTQFSYGPRVGCLLISPYSKRGVSCQFHSHVSLVKFCEATFGLKPINARDAASDGMEDGFDFAQRALGPPK
jgi:phospholipase C